MQRRTEDLMPVIVERSDEAMQKRWNVAQDGWIASLVLAMTVWLTERVHGFRLALTRAPE